MVIYFISQIQRMSIQKIIILSVSILISCAGMAQEAATKRIQIFITLNISEKQYPSLGGFISQRADSSVLLKTIIPDSTAFRQLSRCSFELPTVKVTGRKLKPMNSRNLMPDRFLEEGNANFERMPTMELLLSRIGLWVSDAEIFTDDGEEITVRCAGKRVRNKFVPAEVKLNGIRVSDYELADIILMNPNEIKQIEYFVSSNYEVFGNLGGIKSLSAAAICSPWSGSTARL